MFDSIFSKEKMVTLCDGIGETNIKVATVSNHSLSKFCDMFFLDK